MSNLMQHVDDILTLLTLYQLDDDETFYLVFDSLTKTNVFI